MNIVVGVGDGHDLDPRVRTGEGDDFWSDDAAFIHLGVQQKRRAAQVGEQVEQVQDVISVETARTDAGLPFIASSILPATSSSVQPSARFGRARGRLVAAEADRANQKGDQLHELGDLFGVGALFHARVFEHHPIDRQVATRRPTNGRSSKSSANRALRTARPLRRPGRRCDSLPLVDPSPRGPSNRPQIARLLAARWGATRTQLSDEPVIPWMRTSASVEWSGELIGVAGQVGFFAREAILRGLELGRQSVQDVVEPLERRCQIDERRWSRGHAGRAACR